MSDYKMTKADTKKANLSIAFAVAAAAPKILLSAFAGAVLGPIAVGSVIPALAIFLPFRSLGKDLDRSEKRDVEKKAGACIAITGAALAYQKYSYDHMHTNNGYIIASYALGAAIGAVGGAYWAYNDIAQELKAKRQLLEAAP